MHSLLEIDVHIIPYILLLIRICYYNCYLYLSLVYVQEIMVDIRMIVWKE